MDRISRLTHRRNTLAASLLVGALLSPAATLMLVAAAPSSAQAKGTPRQQAVALAAQALDLFKAADYEAALAKFTEADGLYPAPTLKLRRARCLEKLDRLLDAAIAYRQVIAAEIKVGAPRQHHQARKDAIDELAVVLEATPKLSLAVSGEGAGAAVVTLDGRELERRPAGLLIDPGSHAIEVRSEDGRHSDKQFTTERGESANVKLALAAPKVEAPMVKPGMGAADPKEEPSAAWPIIGWSALGLGSAGLVLGAVTGGLAAGQQSDLEPQCPNAVCGPALADDVDSLDTLRTTSTIGFVAGGVLVGAGVLTLLLTSGGGGDDEAEPSGGLGGDDARISVEPVIGLGFFGAKGTF